MHGQNGAHVQNLAAVVKEIRPAKVSLYKDILDIVPDPGGNLIAVTYTVVLKGQMLLQVVM